MKQNRINIFLSALAFAAVPVSGAAQNLNPVVEISKSYVGKLSETRKPIETMAVPDSLMRFDLDFDYSVFDNPYRGAYIFNPYVVDIKPQKAVPQNKQFYFRAGAGYQLRPELDLFWSPKTVDGFKLNVYAKGNGFMGNYKNVGPLRTPEPGETRIPMAARHSGYDFEERAGLNGIWDWKTGRMLFDLAYSGMHNSDSLISSSCNAMELGLRVQSNKRQRPYFFYDAALNVRVGMDKIVPDAAAKGLLPALPLDPKFSGTVPAVWVKDYPTHFADIVLDGTLGPKFNSGSYFLMDFHMGYHRLSLSSPNTIGSFNATPRYVLEKNRWKLSAGVKLATVYKSAPTDENAVPNEFGSYLGETNVLGSGSSQHFYPFFYVKFEAVKDYFNICFKVDGGDQIQDYTTLKRRNHFFNMTSATGAGPVIANSVNQYDFTLGFSGNIAKCFDYNVYGGYRSWRNGMVDMVCDMSAAEMEVVPWMASVGYQNFKQAYANVDFAWNYRNILVDASFRYNYTDLYKQEKMGFEPARFASELSFRYNWKNRLHIGLSAASASARRGYMSDISNFMHEDGEIVIRKYDAEIPSFVDLGVSAEFFLNRKMSIWLRGDNILNQSVQRAPLYPQAGIGFTAGICINL